RERRALTWLARQAAAPRPSNAPSASGTATAAPNAACRTKNTGHGTGSNCTSTGRCRAPFGFDTFEELVTNPEGLAYPDYAKFRGIAVSEPGVMNEREYDLLTVRPDGRRHNRDGGNSDSATRSQNRDGVSVDKARWLRAIDGADPFVRRL